MRARVFWEDKLVQELTVKVGLIITQVLVGCFKLLGDLKAEKGMIRKISWYLNDAKGALK